MTRSSVIKLQSNTLAKGPKRNVRAAKANIRKMEKTQKRSCVELPPPKRPMNAYNFFFKQHREDLLGGQQVKSASHKCCYGYTVKKKRAHVKVHWKFPLHSLVRTVALKWRALDSTEVEHYAKLAKADNERYQNDVAIYKQLLNYRSAIPFAPPGSGTCQSHCDCMPDAARCSTTEEPADSRKNVVDRQRSPSSPNYKNTHVDIKPRAKSLSLSRMTQFCPSPRFAAPEPIPLHIMKTHSMRSVELSLSAIMRQGGVNF
jgi:hypothetical protein